ncbi:Sugar phosphate isomerase/epimerase [Granulicella pectinivorans]|uniref:Sugar phosphate isomerase/epimerase n=1 Tax=Granulicella pectinivorans TaxID=474950 RepID=A0A1I6MDB2_9BACT|nr:sugar phosphate isomerase/epimerase [Granulicella pectinivorans]SFS13603.1 Sugar phosphate isomerase/epimerase [Granulicella pectinivorans]
MKNTLSRRSLLRTSAALSASAMLSPLSAVAEPPVSGLKPSPIRLGIASYTFRKFDSAKLMEFAKQLKTPYLNLKDMHLPMVPADKVKAEADAYRAAGFTLVAMGTVTFNKDEDDDIRSKFEYAKAAGIPVIVSAPTHEVLPRLNKFVKEYDIKLAIHNHGTEDKNFPSPLDVLKAVDKLDPRIGCCIDAGHCLRAGVLPEEAILKVGPRLFDMHVKDLADASSRDSQVAVGEGILNFPGIFKSLIAIKYPGTVDLEYEIKADDPMPGVVESFAYMRGVLAGMGYKG